MFDLFSSAAPIRSFCRARLPTRSEIGTAPGDGPTGRIGVSAHNRSDTRPASLGCNRTEPAGVLDAGRTWPEQPKGGCARVRDPGSFDEFYTATVQSSTAAL